MIGVAGAGAFGTALAVAFAREGLPVRLWGRDPGLATRRESPRLPGVTLPPRIEVVETVSDLARNGPVLLAMPMQALREFLAAEGQPLLALDLVACCKGIDLTTLQGPAEVIEAAGARGARAVLTGPSFAADIARGLPTALTLACTDAGEGAALQSDLSTPTLRLYRTTDTAGAELGGALKNVVAIAAGVCIGAGLGESARAATVTRGFAEMTRLAAALGARPETLMGLSGLGDLVLTCTSDQSRNFRAGRALGAGQPLPPDTTEGLATAAATLPLAARMGVEVPLTAMVAALAAGRIRTENAIAALLSRPLKEE